MSLRSTPTSGIQLIAEVPRATSEALRQTLLRSYSTFDLYRGLFDGLGISREDILNLDPLSVLLALPLLDGSQLIELAEESLRVGDQITDIETSSGTTGPRKRRFISRADDLSETEFLAELFSICGIGASDRVACLDTDPLTLMVSFTRAFDLLGVEEAYAYSVGSDFGRTLEALPRLDPSVIVVIPSVIERCFDALERHYRGAQTQSLAKVIYVGEPPGKQMRTSLESAFGVEVYGYYGASETSALGIECRAHDGIHLPNDRNLIEMTVDDASATTGEIVVTTLRQQTLPLLRYALRDVIEVKAGACPCGLSHPRVEVKGRAVDSFSILGAKMNYAPILDAVYSGVDFPGAMQIVLTRERLDKLAVVVPESLRKNDHKIKQALLKSQPDLDFLVRGGFLNLQVTFTSQNYFDTTKKRKRVLDLREASDAEQSQNP